MNLGELRKPFENRESYAPIMQLRDRTHIPYNKNVVKGRVRVLPE